MEKRKYNITEERRNQLRKFITQYNKIHNPTRIHFYSPKRRKEIGEQMRKFWKEKRGKWFLGRKHWRDRIYKSKEYIKFRKLVFERDNYTCRKCKNNKGGKLNVHHIKNFLRNPESRYWIKNGITFCKNCHLKFHSIYGIENNNKKQIKDFVNILL